MKIFEVEEVKIRIFWEVNDLMNFNDFGKNLTYYDIKSDYFFFSFLNEILSLIYAFWYLPMYVTYAKILVHVHDHIRHFYDNYQTLPCVNWPPEHMGLVQDPNKIKSFWLKYLYYLKSGSHLPKKFVLFASMKAL